MSETDDKAVNGGARRRINNTLARRRTDARRAENLALMEINRPLFGNFLQWIDTVWQPLQDLPALRVLSRGNAHDPITPANLAFIQHLNVLDEIYENRNHLHAKNYHTGIHGELTIYQKIHDPLFRNLAHLREAVNQEEPSLYRFNTECLLTVGRMESVNCCRLDTHSNYVEYMADFFAEEGAIEKTTMLATLNLSSQNIKAPLVFLCICARILLLSLIADYASIIKLAEYFEDSQADAVLT